MSADVGTHHDRRPPSRPIPQNQRSSKRIPLATTGTLAVPATTADDDNDNDNDLTELANFPVSDPNNTRTHHCFAAVVEPAAGGLIHTDQRAVLLSRPAPATTTSSCYTTMMTTTAYSWSPCATAPALASSAPSRSCTHTLSLQA
ncbi:hypothetical protein MHU86_1116 [Fragilaria crotonensis]|nr:hypothetical protein MHU86_1116 [Fragilaria crotonensis]